MNSAVGIINRSRGIQIEMLQWLLFCYLGAGFDFLWTVTL